MCAVKALPSISAQYVLYGRWPHLWAENHIDSVRVYLRASGGNFIEEIKRRQDAGPALEQRNGHSGTEQDTVGQSRSWRENCWHCPLQCFSSEAQLCSLLLTTIAAHDFQLKSAFNSRVQCNEMVGRWCATLGTQSRCIPWIVAHPANCPFSAYRGPTQGPSHQPTCCIRWRTQQNVDCSWCSLWRFALLSSPSPKLIPRSKRSPSCHLWKPPLCKSPHLSLTNNLSSPFRLSIRQKHHRCVWSAGRQF